MRTREYRPLIDACALQVGLPPWGDLRPGEWLEGLVLQESGGDPRARRYEPHQDRPGRADAAGDGDQPDVDDGELEDDASYGLMQVMGSNARRLCGLRPGTPMRFGFLLLPITNLAFGLRILAAELVATQGSVVRALCRFNGGPTGDALVSDGRGATVFRRQVYADGVVMHARAVREDRQRAGRKGVA